jgi:hypothetical protein
MALPWVFVFLEMYSITKTHRSAVGFHGLPDDLPIDVRHIRRRVAVADDFFQRHGGFQLGHIRGR